MKTLYKGFLTVIGLVGLWLGAGMPGLAQTPVLIKSGAVSGFITTPNSLYFRLDGFLWRTDGTSAGTVTVKNSAGDPVKVTYSSLSSDGTQQVVFNGRLYFEGLYNASPSLMYVDDSGIAQQVNGQDRTYSPNIARIITFDNQLYFTTAINANNLWRLNSDGTQAILVGYYPFQAVDNIVAYKGQLYYLIPKVSSNSTDPYNKTLWRIPLPSTTAVAVTDLPLLTNQRSYDFLVVANGLLYTGGRSSTVPYPAVVYQSDGTAAGTIAVSSVLYLGSSSYYIPGIVNDQLYLVGYTLAVGYTGGLYKVNPTSHSIETATDVTGQLPVGTTISLKSFPKNFVNYKGLFYFSAFNSSTGSELWRSDGTLVKDIQPGPGTSDPQDFFVHNGSLYFNAEGSSVGRELYRTDGTDVGTQLVADLNPGSVGSSPRNFISFNNELYFTIETQTGQTGLYVNALYKLPNSTVTPPTPTTTGLTLTTPTYDCTSGQLTAQITGGNGLPIEYRIAGLRDFSASPTFFVPTYQRNGTTFTIEARQSGAVVSLSFATACQTTTPTTPTTPEPPITPPATTGLSLAQPAYDCNTGQLALSTTGGNGSLVEYRIAGLRDWASNNTFTVPSYQRMGTSFTLEARQSGAVVSLPFTSACQTTTPPTTPTNPTTPPATGQALTVSATPLNCQTGALQLIAAGGDGTPIAYKVPGLGDYTFSSTFTVPAYQRTGTSFTLYARQSGREVTGSYTAACPVSSRMASPETGGGLKVVVYPNPVGEHFTVGVSGAAGQSVRFHLTNLQGQTVLEQRAAVVSDTHTETLMVPASGAGMYLLQVSTPTQSKTLKVLRP